MQQGGLIITVTIAIAVTLTLAPCRAESIRASAATLRLSASVGGMYSYRFFHEKGGHTKLFQEKGGQIFFITKRVANGHIFHEKGGQTALWRLIDQGYADN